MKHSEIFSLALAALRLARTRRNILIVTLLSVVASSGMTLAGLPHVFDLETLPPEKFSRVLIVSVLFSAGIPLMTAPLIAWGFETAIYQLRATKAELARVARSDYLTGLLNRHGFYEQANKLIAKAHDEEKPVATLMVDIDHFKKINDTFGHSCGDAAICHVASQIRDSFENGVVSRIGGEEFAVVLSGVPLREVLALAERVRERCERMPLTFDGIAVPMTVSIGTAIDSHQGGDIQELMKRADLALYRAKKSGRNRIAKAA